MQISSGPLPPDVVDALRRGNKIEAIKLLRQATGLGLAEAKARVDIYELAGGGKTGNVGMSVRHVTARGEHLSPGEVPRSTAGLGVFVLIALVILGIFLYTQFIR
ncbi:MAG: ribosomal protein L7/L12 [Usitatibacter sp.]